MAACATLFALAFCSPSQAGPDLPPGYLGGATFAQRSGRLIDLLTTTRPTQPDYPKNAMTFYVARLSTGRDTDFAISALDTMMDATLHEKRQDPFNLHAIMHGFLICPDKYPPALIAKFKAYAAQWDFTRPIGVSLNYELMRDGAGYLAAQQWSDLHDKAGNDAAKIRSLCSARLIDTFDRTISENATEYDSPLYSGTDYMALRMLAEYANDSRLRAKATMTLHWMLVMAGCYWDQGYYITSSGRAKYWGSSDLSPNSVGPTTGMAYLLFGGARPAKFSDSPESFWIAHAGQAVPSDWLPAWQASLPLPRTVLSSVIIPEHKMLVRKMAWLTRDYGLASERTDGSPPDSYLYKENRRVMLKWISDRPSSTFTFLQQNRRRPSEHIINAFAYGENPYTQVMQFQGTLIGVYDVPADYGFWKLQLPFTQQGAILKRIERAGWVFCHCGRILFAVRSIQPATWAKPDTREHLDLLECDNPRNGYILETSPTAAFAGGGVDSELSKFADAILTRTRTDASVDSSPPRVSFTSLSGHVLQIVWHPPQEPYSGQCVLDGKPVDYAGYPLLSCPHAQQTLAGPLILELPAGGRRIYDFKLDKAQ